MFWRRRARTATEVKKSLYCEELVLWLEVFSCDI